jgi:hypothetical protein
MTAAERTPLDERIARDCERSGVPFFVEDEAVLERIAALLDGMEDVEGGGGRAPAA